MEGSTVLWIVLGIVALLAIAAAIYFATRKQKDTRRRKAKSLREDAKPHVESLREREASAEQAHSRAQRAQAEAEAKGSEARKLRERAQREEQAARESREKVKERLRKADKIDPDTDHRKG